MQVRELSQGRFNFIAESLGPGDLLCGQSPRAVLRRTRQCPAAQGGETEAAPGAPLAPAKRAVSPHGEARGWRHLASRCLEGRREGERAHPLHRHAGSPGEEEGGGGRGSDLLWAPSPPTSPGQGGEEEEGAEEEGRPGLPAAHLSAGPAGRLARPAPPPSRPVEGGALPAPVPAAPHGQGLSPPREAGPAAHLPSAVQAAASPFLLHRCRPRPCARTSRYAPSRALSVPGPGGPGPSPPPGAGPPPPAPGGAGPRPLASPPVPGRPAPALRAAS